MTIYAGTIADELGSIDDYDGTPEEYFKELSESVKTKFGERYPKLFGAVEEEEDEPKPVKKKLSVEGVSQGRRTSERSRSATPAEREQAQRFVNLGVFPSLDVALKEIVSHVG